MQYDDLDRETILDQSIYTFILSITDPSERETHLQQLETRAKEIGRLQSVKKLFKEYTTLAKQKRSSGQRPEVDGVTHFTFDAGFLEKHSYAGALETLRCGEWIATNEGIFIRGNNGCDLNVCRAPITIISKSMNFQTGFIQTEIAWARNGIWRSMFVPQSMIAIASKLVSLSDYGFPVTSENAKALVKYLSEINMLNMDELALRISTAKLGWFDKWFVPYDDEVMFDGNKDFRFLSASLISHGSYETWLDHIRILRQTGKIEVKVMMAASFASVLVHIVNALPFICSLWGDTEGGKTLTLMVAASIWGDPNENHLIGDFKCTETSLEVRADLLNHLPMILDDTSKVSKRIGDNMEGFVYDVVSGKGKSRSTKDLGARRENTWQNSILVTGERPLSSYVSQGGAINRIIEVKCSQHIFDNPKETARIVKDNYGFAGKMFVKAVKEMNPEKIRGMYSDYYNLLLRDEDSMEKQAASMAVILTADRIADEMIFNDGMTIATEDARRILTRRSEISDGLRGYNYLVDIIRMNPSRFDSENKIEQWGVIEGEEHTQTAYLYPAALDKICRDGDISRKALESWMIEKDLLIRGSNGKTSSVKWLDGTSKRMIAIVVSVNAPDKDGFMMAMPQEKPP